MTSKDGASSDSDSSSDIIYTPADSESTSAIHSSLLPSSSQRHISRSPLRLTRVLPNFAEELRSESQGNRQKAHEEVRAPEYNPSRSRSSSMSSSRPNFHRPTRGLSNQPLLQNGNDDSSRGRHLSSSNQESPRPQIASRRNTFRSKSPSYAQPENVTRRKYTFAAFFLLISLISFVVQTETAVYIQHDLGWKKAYCMLWLTHSSWSLLWPTQLLIIRIQKRKLSWEAFWRRHKYLIRTTAQMVESRSLYLSPTVTAKSPWPYMIRTTVFVASFLTVAGGSWYVAVDLTSPSDLTAIYNCSAFFAYVFSIFLLNDKLRFDKLFSVGLAIAGVLVVAYGDKEAPKTPGHSGGSSGGNPNQPQETDYRLIGNLIIGFGSILYGLYEVLYKRMGCPPEGTSPGRAMIFANTFGSLIGTFTFTVLWIPLPILHFTGIETFELPRGETAYLLAISTLSNAVFSGSFLILMSLTSPVLSSVAALLTIFLVAIVDWMITGKPLSVAALAGGSLIIVAFFMLSWATYREMNEDQLRRERENELAIDSGDEGDEDDDNM